MKLIMKVVAGVLLTISVAQASCPVWSPYRCVPGPNGKMICGCGV